MDRLRTEPSEVGIGVVGIGLMGSSIIVSLLSSGHRVKAIAPIASDYRGARERIEDQLKMCSEAGLMTETVVGCLKRLEISQDYGCLSGCGLVLECVIEDLGIKSEVYQKITGVIAGDAILASNTSAIAITTLQKLVLNPDRFLGIHWAEPAYATRFMEITCGELTDMRYAEWVFHLAHRWGKEPTLLKKDIRGFITNRLMYAVYREMFALIESGRTTIEDADKAFRYDAGSWITLMGLFRRMDYLGLGDQARIFRDVFPQLSNSDQVPAVMEQIVARHGRGIQDLEGLYRYTEKEAKDWEAAFAMFNEEIFHLASRYPDPLLIKGEQLA